MERKSRYLPIVIFILSACSPKGFQEPVPLASLKNEPTQPTAKIQQPYYSYKVGKGTVVEGLVKQNDLKLNIESETKKSSLKGNVTVNFIEGGQAVVPVDVAGTINPDSNIGPAGFMDAVNADALAANNLRVRAKITCLTENCADSFIDIYVVRGNYVYRLQVEANTNVIPDFSQGNYPQNDEPETNSGAGRKDSPKKDSSKDSSKKDQPAKQGPSSGYEPTSPSDNPSEDQEAHEDDGSQYEHGEGPVDGAENGGSYVGQPVSDIEASFPDLSEPKAEEPKKEDSKTDTKGSKKDDQKDTKKDDKKSDSNSDSKDTGIVGTIVRKVNQAVTAVMNRKGRPNFTIGRLENATNIYSYQLKVSDAGFRFVYPKRETYFGTDDMLAALVSIGQFNKAHVNGYVNNVGDISKEKGGQLGRHSSHQQGIDADISYYFDDKAKQKGLDEAVVSSKPVKSFMEEEQWEMFKSLTEKNIVTFIFVDKAIKKDLCALAARKGEVKSGDTTSVAFKTLRLLNTTAPGHDDHFHLRLKCSQAQPRCRQQPLPTGSSTGC